MARSFSYMLSMKVLFSVCVWVAALQFWCLGLASSLQAAEPRVLRTIADFEQARETPGTAQSLGPIRFWRWTDEEKNNAERLSQLDLVIDDEPAPKSAGGNTVLKVTIPQGLPKGSDYYPLWNTGLDYLPPEAVLVRMRVKVVSGRFHLTVGSPTAYFATSDVRARPQVLEMGDWQTVEFSLVRDLERNYRRPIFSQESPVIYYTRWIQEPMRLLVSADSQGELQLDDIELVATGGGQPFSTYASGAVRSLSEADVAKLPPFTFATDDREYDLSHTLGKMPVRKPAVLTYPLLPPASSGHGLWMARQRGQEEMSFFGVQLQSPPDTNGVRVKLKVEHEGKERFAELSVDVLVMIGSGGTFPWLKATSTGPAAGYDYCLSPGRTKGQAWGMYHARRAVRPGEWSELVIPFSDFVCIYGSGSLKSRQLKQQPLLPGEVMGLAFVSSYRQNRADTIFTMGKIESVAIAAGSTGVSYPIVPDLSRIRLESEPGESGRKAR